MDVASIPIGAYEPRWFMKDSHCNVEEAIQIHKDIKSKKMNINLIYSLLKKENSMNLREKSLRYNPLFTTSEWYKKYYGKK